MTFWFLVGLMSILALAFVLLPIVKPGIGRKPLLIIGLALGVPLAAVLAYQQLGTPVAATQSAMSVPPVDGQMPPGHSSNGMNMDLGKLADKLAAKLQANPDNAEGWALLARTYVNLNRIKEALVAFEKASALSFKDPGFYADYADILALSNGGQFDKKSVDLVDQALALNPTQPKALMLKATIAFNSKNYQAAIESWEKLLKVPGLDAETTKETSGSIEEARRLLSAKK